MNLTPVLARLKSQLTGFRKIGGAADLEAIGSGVVPAPAVFLLPGKEVASDIDIAGDTIQRVHARFSLVHWVSLNRFATRSRPLCSAGRRPAALML
jgi:hypothetical protein